MKPNTWIFVILALMLVAGCSSGAESQSTPSSANSQSLPSADANQFVGQDAK
ncbi:MAG: hypothetical protein WCK51_07645 [Armatimonadota bacterium]